MAIVTIGGNLGAGKTTFAEKLSKALGYENFYVGGIFRDMAAKHGMSIEDFYAALAKDPKLERSVDDRQKELMRTKNDVVVQGRVAWHFAKESPFPVFNIFLGVNQTVGAQRGAQRKENAGKSIDEILRANLLRESTEVKRYHDLYGIENVLDPTHYDYVLDTSELTEKEVLEKVIEKLRLHLEPDL